MRAWIWGREGRVVATGAVHGVCVKVGLFGGDVAVGSALVH